MARPFFQASRDYLGRHNALNDFVHAASAALWNTRWQVRGYVAAMPSATHDDLQARFVHGSGINGVNIKRSFVDRSWEDDQHELALLLLTNVFSLYEGWAAEMSELFGDDDAAKQLQFPSRHYRTRYRRNGVRDAIRRMANGGISPAMTTAFAIPLKADKQYREAELDELLLVYRYFKECRNSYAHANGGATAGVVAAYADLANTTAATLKARELPKMSAPTLGDPVVLSLRGVIGLTGIVYQMVRTIDALLAATVTAEQEFLSNYRQRLPAKTMLPAHGPARQTRLRYLCWQLGYSRPAIVAELDTLLSSEGLTWPT